MTIESVGTVIIFVREMNGILKFDWHNYQRILENQINENLILCILIFTESKYFFNLIKFFVNEICFKMTFKIHFKIKNKFLALFDVILSP